MARRAKKAGSKPRASLTLALGPERKERLLQLVESRTLELQRLTGQNIKLTTSDVVRWLIDREAEARGIVGPNASPSEVTDAMVPTTIPMSSTRHVPVSSSMPEVLRPVAGITDSHVRAAMAAEPTLLSEGEDEMPVDPTPDRAPRTRKDDSLAFASLESLRERVEEALSRGRFTQRELAERSGVSRPMVSRFVRGGDVTAETLRRLERGLHAMKARMGDRMEE